MARSILGMGIKAIRHPNKAIHFAMITLDKHLMIAEYRKVSHKGERLVIKDWESARISSSFVVLAHVQRYEWVLPLIKDATVLDNGCGSGYGTQYLATNGVQSIVGVDISKEAIEFARKYYQAENLMFMEMDSLDLKLCTMSFDAVISFDVLEHIPSKLKEKFISETARVLIANGTSYIGWPNSDATSAAKFPNPYHYVVAKETIKGILSRYYGSVQFYGQELVLNGIKQGRNSFQQYLDHGGISRENFIIVDEDCDSAFGILAVCRKPKAR